MEASVTNTSRDSIPNGNGEGISAEATEVRIPIVGFEVMDERARFTVFKLKIENEKLGDSWLVFRRYTDFVRLHNKLKEEFPNLNIPLPPKRWLRDNFEPAFLEDRMKGLQAFVDSILLLQPNLTQSPTVREFFCLDEPPVYPENAEESRAMFGTVEENIMHLKQQISNKDLEIEILKTELALVTSQRDNLVKSIKSCKNCSLKISVSTMGFPHCESPNMSSSDVGDKTPIQPVPQRQRNGSTSDFSASSSPMNGKSLQNSPKTQMTPCVEPTTKSTSPEVTTSSPVTLNGNYETVIENSAPEGTLNGH